jgi:hypothetical protein
LRSAQQQQLSVDCKFGQIQNYNTLSDKDGEEYEHWTGVDGWRR